MQIKSFQKHSSNFQDIKQLECIQMTEIALGYQLIASQCPLNDENNPNSIDLHWN